MFFSIFSVIDVFDKFERIVREILGGKSSYYRYLYLSVRKLLDQIVFSIFFPYLFVFLVKIRFKTLMSDLWMEEPDSP